MLTQPGHVDEQLKERLKSQKELYRKCLLKIVQGIFYHSRQGFALRTDPQDEETHFKQLHLLRAEDDEVIQKWIEVL